MKRLEKYTEIAISLVETSLIKGDYQINPTLDNLVTEFGITIRNIGLKSTVVFFEENGQEISSKKWITNTILKIILIYEDAHIKSFPSLLNYLKGLNDVEEYLAKRKILDAAVALKLALRLFIKSDE